MEASYITSVEIAVLEYETPGNGEPAGNFYVDKFQVVFANPPTDVELQELCNNYKIRVQDTLDEIVTFQTKERLFESDLNTIKEGPNIVSVSLLAYGGGYSVVPFSHLKSLRPLTPNSPPLIYEADAHLNAEKPVALIVEMRFEQAGRYKLSAKIHYDNKDIESSPFLVSLSD